MCRPRHTLADALSILETGLHDGSIILEADEVDREPEKKPRSIVIREFSVRWLGGTVGRRVTVRQGKRIVLVSSKRSSQPTT